MKIRILIFVGLVLTHQQVNAADAPARCDLENVIQGSSSIVSAVWVRQQVVNSKDCYYGEVDTTDWVVRLRALLQRTERIEVLQEAVQLVLHELGSESKSVPYKVHLKDDLAHWKDELDDLKPGQFPNYLGSQNRYTLGQNGLSFGNFFDLNQDFDEPCEKSNYQRNNTGCLRVASETGIAIRYIAALADINRYSGDIKEVLSGLVLLDKQWTAYFDEARSQNPLELLINSSIANRNRSSDGFQEVPNWQAIALHPSIAFEYINSADDGEQFRESLVIEAVGMNFWKWSKAGKMQRPLGISLIAAYSDRDEVKDLGWGLMAHYKHKYSLGVTKHGSKTGYFLSLDLQQFFSKWTDKGKAKFDKYNQFLDKL